MPKCKAVKVRQAIRRRDFLKSSGALVVGACGIIATPIVASANSGPVWIEVPNQNWTVGVPVYLELGDYCTDPEGDDLVFTLSGALPDGVTLEGSIISGKPKSVTPSSEFVATAEDGIVAPNAPSNLSVE